MNRPLSNNWLWRLIARLAFNRVDVVGKERIPASGPILFVATHRNGALDAAPYSLAVPAAMPMVSAQLHRLPLGRFLFQGIAVARTKDRNRGIEANNTEATRHCIDLLKGDGQLFIMPEGTSTLGHAHLPYHRGAARILHAALGTGVRPAIVPLAVHYEDPTVWQSRAEVVVGEPIFPQASDDVATLHQHITRGLESVGANFASAEAQRRAEMLAYASTLGTPTPYARALKNFEQAMPDALVTIVRELEQISQRERLCLHQGVPLTPLGPWLLYALYWMLLAPFVAAFAALNAPVLLAGHVASRKLPDDANVIAFWRMVAALPVALLWLVVANALLLLACGMAAVVSYWLLTAVGLAAWYRFRKLSVALCNRLLHRSARPALLGAYRKLMDWMTHEKIA
ncbi:MAG TPA: 1-acyl-sn-glycerol-3-phosphate acyltransferase [Gallionellaceae bacterium]